MNVPYYGLDREFAVHGDALMEAVREVLASGQVLQGRQVAELENNVASLCGRSYAIAVGSCSDALFYSLVALGISPGDEVLVTDFSFVASASCILRAGATPVLVDIDERSYNMDLGATQKLLSPKTKAMIYVHLYGQMGDPGRIEAFARDNGILVVEDAAQAFGASRQGRPAGSLGQVSCLSFDPTKTLPAPGSGGMVLTDDEALAKHVTRLRYHGKEGNAFHHLGYNSQMPSLTAAILGRRLAQNDAWLARRRAIAARYIDSLNETFTLPVEAPDSTHIYHKFVLATDNRDALRKHCQEQGIATGIHYATPLRRYPLFAAHAGNLEDVSCADRMAQRVLSLPIHPFVTDEEVDHVIDSLNAFSESASQ